MEGIQQKVLGPQTPQHLEMPNSEWPAADIFSLVLSQIFTKYLRLKQTNKKQGRKILFNHLLMQYCFKHSEFMGFLMNW